MTLSVSTSRAGCLVALLFVIPAAACKETSGPGSGPPSVVAMVSGDGQTGEAGGELRESLVVRVTDAQGRVTPGVELVFQITSGSGRLVAPTRVDSLGQAAARWTLGTSTADTQRVEARLPGGGSVPYVTFRAVAVPGSPYVLARVSGDGQEAEPASTLPQKLVAVVRDRYGNAVPRVTVQWSADAGTLSPLTDLTDADGLSRASWTLPTTTGSYLAHAASAALPGVSFSARSVASAVASLGVQPKTVDFDALGDTLLLRADARDRFGNPVSAGLLWRSLATNVVSVSPAGLLRSTGNGTTRIVVSAGSIADTVTATVAQRPVRLQLMPATVTLNALGDTASIQARALDRNGQEIVAAPVAWISANAAVAEVGAGGLVTARAVGQTTLTARVGTLSAAADITVRQVLAFLRLASAAQGVMEGDTIRLSAMAVDSNGYVVPGGVPTWSSSSPDVAAVVGGLVSGVRFGAADISASVSGATGTLRVYVVAPSGHVAGGSYHTCAVSAGRQALCWGMSDEGQLGNGSFSADVVATPVAVSGQVAFTSVATAYRTVCGVAANGAGYCWGRNNGGQVGDGSFYHRSVPTAVVGGLTFTMIAPGDYHACGLTPAGQVYCWGDNSYGQLGGSNLVSTARPIPVQSSVVFRSLAAGLNHTCGLATDGAAYCWGMAAMGATGRGTSVWWQTSVLPVLTDKRFTQISAGGDHTCGLTVEGELYCWGRYFVTGSSSDILTVPTLQAGTFVTVASGRDHDCALKRDMKLRCWGVNSDGQLGIGTRSDGFGAGDVLGPKVFVALGLGNSHSCGIVASGEAYCWGTGAWGQLGDGSSADAFAPGRPVIAPGGFR